MRGPFDVDGSDRAEELDGTRVEVRGSETIWIPYGELHAIESPNHAVAAAAVADPDDLRVVDLVVQGAQVKRGRRSAGLDRAHATGAGRRVLADDVEEDVRVGHRRLGGME